jgi:hypothetical protein
MSNPTYADHSHPPPGPANSADDLTGIGGWLYLPAIGLILGAVLGAIGLAMLITGLSNAAAAGYASSVMAELVINGLMYALLLYITVRFFGKKRDAPILIIAFLAATVATSIVLLIFHFANGAGPFVTGSVTQLVRAIVSAAVWIPYFRVSRRVKATFTH